MPQAESGKRVMAKPKPLAQKGWQFLTNLALLKRAIRVRIKFAFAQGRKASGVQI